MGIPGVECFLEFPEVGSGSSTERRGLVGWYGGDCRCWDGDEMSEDKDRRDEEDHRSYVVYRFPSQENH